MTRRLNTMLIAENWEEMLRVAASLKYGHVTASLIVGKLSRADRQNTLAAALANPDKRACDAERIRASALRHHSPAAAARSRLRTWRAAFTAPPGAGGSALVR